MNSDGSRRARLAQSYFERLDLVQQREVVARYLNLAPMAWETDADLCALLDRLIALRKSEGDDRFLRDIDKMLTPPRDASSGHLKIIIDYTIPPDEVQLRIGRNLVGKIVGLAKE